MVAAFLGLLIFVSSPQFLEWTSPQRVQCAEIVRKIQARNTVRIARDPQVFGKVAGPAIKFWTDVQLTRLNSGNPHDPGHLYNHPIPEEWDLSERIKRESEQIKKRSAAALVLSVPTFNPVYIHELFSKYRRAKESSENVRPDQIYSDLIKSSRRLMFLGMTNLEMQYNGPRYDRVYRGTHGFSPWTFWKHIPPVNIRESRDFSGLRRHLRKEDREFQESIGLGYRRLIPAGGDVPFFFDLPLTESASIAEINGLFGAPINPAGVVFFPTIADRRLFDSDTFLMHDQIHAYDIIGKQAGDLTAVSNVGTETWWRGSSNAAYAWADRLTSFDNERDLALNKLFLNSKQRAAYEAAWFFLWHERIFPAQKFFESTNYQSDFGEIVNRASVRLEKSDLGEHSMDDFRAGAEWHYHFVRSQQGQLEEVRHYK